MGAHLGTRRIDGGRALRTAVVATTLGLGAHVLAGGQLDLRPLVLVGLAVVALSGIAALHRFGRIASFGSLLGIQALVHMLAANSALSAGSAGNGGLAFMCTPAHHVAGMGSMGATHTALMLCGHATAAAISAWWLARGDGIAIAAYSELRGLVPLPALTLSLPVLALVAGADTRPHTLTTLGSVPGRAPPRYSRS